MANTNDPAAQQKYDEFMKGIRAQLKASRGLLLDADHHPGTEIDFSDIPKLRSGFNDAKEQCKEVVMSGKNCSADFNLGAGKKVGVKIGYSVGLEVEITPAKGMGTKPRKITIAPE